jgi:hypothetical protein
MSVHHLDQGIIGIVGIFVDKASFKVDESAPDLHSKVMMKFVPISPLFSCLKLLVNLAAVLDVLVQ